ncbi:TetR family transcriptional regulator [Thalassotalea sp. G20_0]|uniref:TetR/AcrR family transcriptional regulator n=1 Tax=Gammaproteobacteria TaxID=1236 RepID=UPI001ADAEC65|nr:MULTISPECIES: TetR/AcrR family transcriptional regulator [Gammaproteobacteria]MBO9496036.1 TetR family transcriptional regulator [Thalassotalea sp. G20_0]WBA83922.1 TetR/AcrR family transcriptional regulator [Endozoicomonas sp. GU-1]WBA86902.1 TetR/AcrR family transcriptional regulator [Endozoicomonas sp. GU-1]
MSQSATVDRILDAAEKLFAEHGFAETSLRSITSQAGVNLAAVNYHFGSKKSLIQAVFSRFLDPFVSNLSGALVRYQDNNDVIDLEEILHLLVDQIMAVKPRSPEDLSVCMRMIGLAYTQGQGHLKKYLRDVYGEVFQAYLELLVKACPELPLNDLFWRVYFILGSAVFTLSGADALRAIAESDYGVRTELEDIMRKMVPFMAAGLRSHT